MNEYLGATAEEKLRMQKQIEEDLNAACAAGQVERIAAVAGLVPQDLFSVDPLRTCAIHGQAQCAKVLMHLGFKSIHHVLHGSPLMGAVTNDRMECFDLLWAISDLKERTKDGMTLLTAAARQGRPDAIQKLIASADIHARDGIGFTAYLHACAKSLANVLELELAGACSNDISSRGLNGLHVAAEKGHLDIVNHLLARGADPKSKAANGTTALMMAAGGGHADVVNRLLPLSDQWAVNQQFMMALHHAVGSESEACVRAIAEPKSCAHRDK